jgi:hypothetical protein
LVSCDNRGGEVATLVGDEIAVSARDLLDEVMTAQDAEQIGDLPASFAAFTRRVVGLVEEQGDEVAVAKAVEEELAAGDGAEEWQSRSAQGGERGLGGRRGRRAW